MPLPPLPPDALARAQAAQDALTARFQEIAAALPPETDSALVFQTDAGETE